MASNAPRSRFAGAGWVLACVICWAVGVYVFGNWAPWPSAMSREQAEAQWPGSINPSWRAVVNDHGRPKEWAAGTMADNPVEFGLWTAALAAAVAGFFFCGRQAQRAARDRT